MNITPRPEPSSKLVLTAVLSSSITCVLAIIYIVLGTVALIFRYDCNAGTGDTVSGSAHLISTVYRVYFQDGTCPNSITAPELTTDYSVFVLMCITLAASCICLVAAVILISALTAESPNQYITILTYGYIGVCVASLAVDVTFATHFGIDYSYLTGLLNDFPPGQANNYNLDVIRIGAFVLMTITLKGFVSHILNLILLILLVIYVVEYSKSLEEYEHSIHKLGVIQAYDPKRQTAQNRCEVCQANATLSSNGGPQLNFSYVNDDEPPRSLTRENSRRDDFSTPAFDRSYSWQQGPSPAARPFSYLEEGKRQAAPPSAPAPEPQWRRGPWQGAPPVPAPDYSPQAPRRLKSALKPNYM